MKFKLISACICAIILSSGFICFLNAEINDIVKKSELLLFDIEALAEREGGVFYDNKEGNPKFCTIYKYVNYSLGAEVNLTEENNNLSGDLGWVKFEVEGIHDRCPRDGDGMFRIFLFRCKSLI